mmetsp:Transcript_101572/g.296074  ORF Transcript_101572/g.296074 Transcript_101572/m.296074 type:complete len:855 (+) Transcript_101572:75-2639(+)
MGQQASAGRSKRPEPLPKHVDGTLNWAQLTCTLLQDGYPLRAVQLLGEFLDFLPVCAICGQLPFSPVRCTLCKKIACQPCIENDSTFDEVTCQWVVPCCGGKTHVYDYMFSVAWLMQSPRWPQPSTYRMTYQWSDIKYFSLAQGRMRAFQGTPSVSYVDLHDSGEVLIAITQFSAHMKEVGLAIYNAGHWQRDGHDLRLTLHCMHASDDSGFCTKHATLPAEFVLHEASLTSGSALVSTSAKRGDGTWAPYHELRLLPTGNALVRNKFDAVRCLRWLHGTTNMIVCLCGDGKVVAVKEHEIDIPNGDVVTSWTTSLRHGWWYELGALLLITFSHQGFEQCASSHALFFDAASGTYKGLMTWRDGKVCLHAGEVEARPTSLPNAPCFIKSSGWSELPRSTYSVDSIELPTKAQCDRDSRSFNPANASLTFTDYVSFLLKLMTTNGLDCASYVQLAKEFMKVIELTSHFATAAQPPTKDELLNSCHAHHEKKLLITAFSLAGLELCSHDVENVVGASSALRQLTEVVQPWEDELVHIELGRVHREGGMITRYEFQAVRLQHDGVDITAARSRLSAWGLGCRYLPSQLGMALHGLSAAAKYQLCREYFAQLREDLDVVAQNPLHGSHYIVLLDVSSSMSAASFLQAYPDEAAEFEALGLDKRTLLRGTNLSIVEHILDAFFVPQLLKEGVRVGNAKFSHRLVRVEPPSDAPTPFRADEGRDGGGTEIYCALMGAAAHLTMPVLGMTGDAGVILITDGEQYGTSIDVSCLARLFNRQFRLEVIGIRAQLTGPLQRLVRGSFSVPYQIGNLKNLMTALSETLGRILKRAATAPENRNDIRQPVELYHPHMWYLLDDGCD